jgi:mannose/fructose/N-acetylgalactosamine-specific phosphotransferase system component IIB
MTLVLYRIDDRLIHGQVVVGWAQPLDVRFIVLVDDEVAGSDWEQELYRMGVPPGMQVSFDTITAAIRNIPSYKKDVRSGILVTPDIATMRKLVDAGVVESVNVGGVHHRAGRAQKLRYVFLTADEEDELKAIQAKNVPVSAQDVPSARAVPLDQILAGNE